MATCLAALLPCGDPHFPLARRSLRATPHSFAPPAASPTYTTGLDALQQDFSIPVPLQRLLCSHSTTAITSVNLWMSGGGGVPAGGGGGGGRDGGTASSSCHYDPYSNLLAVVTGTKSLALLSPAATPALRPMALYGDAANHSAATVGLLWGCGTVASEGQQQQEGDDTQAGSPSGAQGAASSDESQPASSGRSLGSAAVAPAGFVQLMAQRFLLHSGDVLFIPAGWWHQVNSSSGTVAVNFWFETAAGGRSLAQRQPLGAPPAAAEMGGSAVGAETQPQPQAPPPDTRYQPHMDCFLLRQTAASLVTKYRAALLAAVPAAGLDMNGEGARASQLCGEGSGVICRSGGVSASAATRETDAAASDSSRVPALAAAAPPAKRPRHADDAAALPQTAGNVALGAGFTADALTPRERAAAVRLLLAAQGELEHEPCPSCTCCRYAADPPPDAGGGPTPDAESYVVARLLLLHLGGRLCHDLGVCDDMSAVLRALQPAELLNVLYVLAQARPDATAELLQRASPVATQLLTDALEEAAQLLPVCGQQEQCQPAAAPADSSGDDNRAASQAYAIHAPPPRLLAPDAQSFYEKLYGTVPDGQLLLQSMVQRREALGRAVHGFLLCTVLNASDDGGEGSHQDGQYNV